MSAIGCLSLTALSRPHGVQGPQRTVGNGLAPASQGYHAGLVEFLDAERFKHPDQGVLLVPVPGGLDGHRVLRDVDDLGAEQGHGLEHPGPGLGVGPHLDQQEFPLHRDGRLQLDDLQYVDQLVELLGDLLQGVLRAVHHDRHPGDLVVLRRAHRQRVDVEAAAGEQPRDADEHAGLVLHKNRQRMPARACLLLPQAHRWLAHSVTSQSGAMSRATLMSSLLVPAATMGQTMASRCTTKSITTGRSWISMACLTTASTSAAFSQRSPAQRYASASLTKSGIRVPAEVPCSTRSRSVWE